MSGTANGVYKNLKIVGVEPQLGGGEHVRVLNSGNYRHLLEASDAIRNETGADNDPMKTLISTGYPNVASGPAGVGHVMSNGPSELALLVVAPNPASRERLIARLIAHGVEDARPTLKA